MGTNFMRIKRVSACSVFITKSCRGVSHFYSTVHRVNAPKLEEVYKRVTVIGRVVSGPGREAASRCRRRIYRSAKNTALLCSYRHIRRAVSVSRPVSDRGRCQRDAESLPPLRARYIPPLLDESDVGASRLLLKTGSILKRF